MEYGLNFDLKDVRRSCTDVLIIGGGSAGVCAAIAAAREGAQAMLVEQAGCAGGMATQGLVTPFMTCYDKDGKNMIIRGLFEEIVNRMVEKGGAIHPSQVSKGTAYTSWVVTGHDHVTPFEPEVLKEVLDEMLTQAGVKILYHTTFIRPLLTDARITGAVLHSKSGFECVEAKVCVDCSGDADVARMCGVAFENGNETLAICQPATMFFRLGNVDSSAVEADIQANIDNFYRKDGVNYRSLHWRVAQARAAGDWDLNRVSIGLFKSVKDDEWGINTSRIMGIDAIDNRSMTQGEIEGRRQVDQILRFFRKYVPGCQNARLLCSGSTLGIRESCHIKGRYQLTVEDLLSGVVPEDSIVLASNSVDVHGRFGPTSNEYMVIENGDYYGIPYRCLLPLGVAGLLVAGRCISASSEAAGAVRVIPPVMGMGQAAGIAAALAAKSGQDVAEIDYHILREHLIKQRAYLNYEI